MYDDLDDGDWFGPAEAGAAYALFRHGQDRQTAQLINELRRRVDDEPDPHETPEVHVHVHLDDEDKTIRPVNALDFSTIDTPAEWDDYIGQEPLKQQLMVRIKAAQARNEPLAHVLLASGYPGVGKTTMARLIAKTMGKKIIELVPPFNIYTLAAAAEQLDDGDILFIDEIHKLADSGARGAELLLKVLEDHVAYLPDGTVKVLKKITVVGATTDKDRLPDPVLDRFKIQPYFQAYDPVELARICIQFAYRHDAGDEVDDDMAMAIADACRGTPRIIEGMVLAARDLAIACGRNATPEELLEFLEVQPDGLTRTHIHYLTALRQYFAREKPKGEGVEYIVGEAAIQQILRETKQGIGRVERFLVERGLIDRTPRGRRLTPLGIARAEWFIANGLGVSDVA